MTHASIIRRSVALLCVPLLLWACSLPADDDVTPIDADALPRELVNTTTTSTTTTTTTLAPVETSEPEETEPSTSTSTTLLAVTTPVRLYYVDPAADGMVGLLRQLPDPNLDTVIGQLQSPPTDLESYGLRTALLPGLIAGTSMDRAVLTVSLNSAVFDPMDEEDKREAIAQMVLTFTSFAVPGAGNIGSVVVQVDGNPIPVFMPSPGTTSEAGAPVYFADFSTLIVGTSETPPTTTEATVPPTETTPAPPPPTG